MAYGVIHNTTLATGNSASSTALACRGDKVAVTFVTDEEITINGEVSFDGVTYVDFPLAYRLDSTDIVPQGILVATEWAGMVDPSGFDYFRLRMTNASGSTATIVATAYRR